MTRAHARLNRIVLALYLAGGFLWLFPGVKLELLRYGELTDGRYFLGYFPNVIPLLPIHWGIQSVTLAGALYALLLPWRRLLSVVPWLIAYTLLALIDVRVLILTPGAISLIALLVGYGIFGVMDEIRPRPRFPFTLPRWAWGFWVLFLILSVFLFDPMLTVTVAVLFNPAWVKPRGQKADLTVFFDGHCGLCNRTVDFLIREDAESRRLRFATLQGPTADLWRMNGRLPATKTTAADDLESLLVVWGERTLDRSDAALAIGEHLGGLWRVFAILARAVPRPLRDGVYRLVARHRYRFFGRRETCRLPTKEERSLFI